MSTQSLVRPLAESVVRIILGDLKQRADTLAEQSQRLGKRVVRSRCRFLREELAELQRYAREHGVLK